MGEWVGAGVEGLTYPTHCHSSVSQGDKRCHCDSAAFGNKIWTACEGCSAGPVQSPQHGIASPSLGPKKPPRGVRHFFCRIAGKGRLSHPDLHAAEWGGLAQHLHGFISNALLPDRWQGWAGWRQGVTQGGCNLLPLLGRGRLEAGGLPSCRGVQASIFFASCTSVHSSQRSEHLSAQSTHQPHHRGWVPVTGLSPHPPSRPPPCPPPLYLLTVAFISPSSSNCPIRLPPLLPIASQHHEPDRPLAGSRVKIWGGRGGMRSVGRQDDRVPPAASHSLLARS